MKKIVLFISVITITSSLMAVDIFTRTYGKNSTPQKDSKDEVEKPAETKAGPTAESKLPRPTVAVNPVTGVIINVDATTPFSEYNGALYFFLSAAEKSQFDGNPFKFAKDIDTCLVCGRQEKKGRSKSSFLESSYNGKIYRFCTLLHEEDFKKEPAKYIRGTDSYSSKQAGKSKLKAAAKTAEKKETKNTKKEADDNVEILAEETVPAVKQPVPPVTNEKGKTSVAPVLNKEIKSGITPAKKEQTWEYQDIIMEE